VPSFSASAFVEHPIIKRQRVAVWVEDAQIVFQAVPPVPINVVYRQRHFSADRVPFRPVTARASFSVFFKHVAPEVVREVKAFG
jgi:hypothetical protein